MSLILGLAAEEDIISRFPSKHISKNKGDTGTTIGRNLQRAISNETQQTEAKGIQSS